MTRHFKSHPGADAGLVVADTVVRVTVKENNGIMVDERGTTIQGPISITSGSNEIRIGGIWSMNDVLQLTTPSTMATPTAPLLIDMPVKPYGKIIGEVAFMVGLMGGITALGAVG
jgi:hypothetical protein